MEEALGEGVRGDSCNDGGGGGLVVIMKVMMVMLLMMMMVVVVVRVMLMMVVVMRADFSDGGGDRLDAAWCVGEGSFEAARRRHEQ